MNLWCLIIDMKDYMKDLIFPPFEYRIRQEEGKDYIFDVVRRKFLVITPEEWVRQHLIHYLINELSYPKSLIKVEDGLKVNRMAKRSDVVVYDRAGKVFMLIECKSHNVKLSQGVMDQLSNYNQKYQASYLVITNGLSVHLCKMDYKMKQSVFLDSFPEFK